MIIRKKILRQVEDLIDKLHEDEQRLKEFQIELKKLVERFSTNQAKVASSYPKDYKDPKPIAEQMKAVIAYMYGELKIKLLQLVQKLSATNNQYANEWETPDYTYPEDYKGPKPIAEQVNAIASMFKLDPTQALEFANNLPMLPEGSEGWFAIPKVSAVAQVYFPHINDKAEQYCEAVKLVCTKLADSRPFRISFENEIDDEIIPSKLRQHPRTAQFLEQLEVQQSGDILIIAAQHGMRHYGESIYNARENFASNEFGLGAFATGCMALVHPERYASWKMNTDCAGDEFNYDYSFGAVCFYFEWDKLNFGSLDYSYRRSRHGSVSGFFPQN